MPEGEVVEVSDGIAEVKRTWWLLALLGLLTMIFGLLLVFWPGPTITTITSIVGLFMVVTGVTLFFVAVFDPGSNERWLIALSGIAGVIIGVIIMKNPDSTIQFVVLATAIFWIISGMVDVFRGIANSNLPGRGVRMAHGAFSALFGVVLLVWPAVTVGVFAILAGLFTVVLGLLELVAAFQLRRA